MKVLQLQQSRYLTLISNGQIQIWVLLVVNVKAGTYHQWPMTVSHVETAPSVGALTAGASSELWCWLSWSRSCLWSTPQHNSPRSAPQHHNTTAETAFVCDSSWPTATTAVFGESWEHSGQWSSASEKLRFIALYLLLLLWTKKIFVMILWSSC